MKTLFKTSLLLTVLLTFVSTSVFAKSFLNASSSGALYTLSVMTPNGQDIFLDTARDYAGSSKNRCSDLSLLKDHTGSAYLWMESGELPFDSEIINRNVGPNKTCFKIDFIYAGKLYSTGPVKLFWDNDKQAYTKASPHSGVINFNS